MSWSAKPGVWSAGSAATDPWSPVDLGIQAAAVVEPLATDPVADAYALGFSEGRTEGERGERARLRSAVRAAEEALESIDATDARWTGAVQENLLALSMAVARHIVDRELALDPDIITRLVRRALSDFPIDQPLKVRVHPDDLAILESVSDRGTAEALDTPARTAHWIGDTRISTGSCVVEGRERIVDGRIETAIERIYRRLGHHHA